MGLRINTNIASLGAQRSLSKASLALEKSFRRLSTGSRIAVAADDAAGLAISERLKARIRSTDQAARNAQDGISMVQTAEGAMSEVNDILVRMRELSVQAGNGTINSADRDTLQQEFAALIEEVDRISGQADFNGINLLDGTAGTAGVVTLQVGADTTAGVDTLDITFADQSASALGIDLADIGSTGDPSAAITSIDAAINQISSARGSMGAVQNRLGSNISTLEVASENLSAANSRIRDVDIASETANLTKNTILQQAAISILSQANVQPQAALALLQG